MQVHSSYIAVLALAVIMTGCFARHSVATDSGVGDPADSSSGDTRSPGDTGSPPIRDASPGVADAAPWDASLEGPPPLPAEPELDLGPDARPSDYPEADGWSDPDPARFPDGEPCCTPVGDEHTLEMGGDGGLANVALEWNGRQWGLLYTDSNRTVFVPLEPLGAPGTHRRLPPRLSFWGDLAWGAGRFGVAVSTEAGEHDATYTATFMLLDERGALASEMILLSPAYRVAMARMTHRDRWAAAWVGGSMGSRGNTLVQEMDADARWLGEPLALPTDRGTFEPQLVGLKSRIVLFYSPRGDDGREVTARVLTTPFAESPVEEVVVFDGSTSNQLGATAFRNVALVSDIRRGDGFRRVAAFDPFLGAVTARATIPIGAGADSIQTDYTGLGASDTRGLVALCLSTTAEPSPASPDTPVFVNLFLFGPNLEQLGEPVVVAEIEEGHRVGCEVGFSGDAILVAWWSWSRPVVHVRAFRP